MTCVGASGSAGGSDSGSDSGSSSGDLNLNTWRTSSDNDEAYFMNLDFGSLTGSGKESSDGHGYDLFKVGDELGILVKSFQRAFN